MELKSFKDIIKESYVKDVSNEYTKIADVIIKTLTFSVQCHIYHLLTTSGNYHQALKDFYETLRDEADELAEKYIGMYGALSVIEEYIFDLKNYFAYDEFLEDLDEYRNDLNQAINLTTAAELQSLNEEFVELQGAVDTLKYKLQMN